MIIKDAKELLIKIYEHYVTIYTTIDEQWLFKNCPTWDAKRIDISLKYLKDLNLINLRFVMGCIDGLQRFISSKLINHHGIDAIEDKEDFMNNFKTSKGWKKR